MNIQLYITFVGLLAGHLEFMFVEEYCTSYIWSESKSPHYLMV